MKAFLKEAMTMRIVEVIVSIVILITCLYLLTGCADTIKALAKDDASMCGSVTVGYGMGAVSAATPVVVPMGGVYTYERFCRTNQPGSTVKANLDGSIEITHGMLQGTVP